MNINALLHLQIILLFVSFGKSNSSPEQRAWLGDELLEEEQYPSSMRRSSSLHFKIPIEALTAQGGDMADVRKPAKRGKNHLVVIPFATALANFGTSVFNFFNSLG